MPRSSEGPPTTSVYDALGGAGVGCIPWRSDPPASRPAPSAAPPCAAPPKPARGMSGFWIRPVSEFINAVMRGYWGVEVWVCGKLKCENMHIWRIGILGTQAFGNVGISRIAIYPQICLA